MMRRVMGVLLVGVALLAGGCGERAVTGDVEALIVAQPCEVAGRVLEAQVSLGQSVAVGDVLAVIDDTDCRYAIAQMEQTLVKKQSALEGLQEGAALAQIKQGRNAVTIAQEGYASAVTMRDRAAADLARQRALWEGGALAQTALDRGNDELTAAETAVTIAAAQLDNAKSQLDDLIDGQATEPQLCAAMADVAQTESQLAQLREEQDKYTIRAQSAGTIVSRPVAAGEMVAAGSDIGDIAVSSEQYLVVYWPVKELEQVSVGQEVTVRTDGQDETGVISFLDVRSEYTPKEQQSSLNRNKQSVKLKVKLAEDTRLKPGQQAEMLLK